MERELWRCIKGMNVSVVGEGVIDGQSRHLPPFFIKIKGMLDMSHVMTHFIWLINKFTFHFNVLSIISPFMQFYSLWIQNDSSNVIWGSLLSFLAFFIPTLFILSLSIPSLCLLYPMSFFMIIKWRDGGRGDLASKMISFACLNYGLTQGSMERRWGNGVNGMQSWEV